MRARSLLSVAASVALAGTLALSATGITLADYGQGAVYQVELTANAAGPNGGGVWLWIALKADGTGDYVGSDCGHGEGAVSDAGDVTWTYDGSSVVISGVALNGLGGFPSTVTVPRTYGHYTGTIGSYLTLPAFIPPFIGTSQLQVAP